MPETASAIGSYFTAGSAATAGAAATDAAVAGDAALAADGSLVAGGAAEGTAGAVAAGGGGGWSALAAGAGKVVAGAAVSAATQSLLAPKRPDLPPPIAMPDPQAQEAARQKAIADMVARRGRASTVLTDPAGSGTLGG